MFNRSTRSRSAPRRPAPLGLEVLERRDCPSVSMQPGEQLWSYLNTSPRLATGITVISAVAAMSARETYRLRIGDLGHPDAVPMSQEEYDRMRAASVADAAKK